MNENENEKCPSLLFCCSSLLVLVLEIESVVSKTKPPRQMHLVAHFGFPLLVLDFCRCFHLNIALLVLVFRWCEKTKKSNKRQKSPNGNQAYVVRIPDLYKAST